MRELQSELLRLEELFSSKVILYISPEKFGKMLSSDDLQTLLTICQSIPKSESVNLILNSLGGSIDCSERFVEIIKMHFKFLNTIPIYTAGSAAALIALLSDRISMTPLSRITPLDPVIYREGFNNDNPLMPPNITSEDIRGLVDMSEDWFKLSQPAERLEVLGLLFQKIFPSTIGRLYRAEKYMINLIAESLQKHSNDLEQEARYDLSKILVRGFPLHNFSLTSRKLQSIGVITYDIQGEALHNLSKIRDMLESFNNISDLSKGIGNCVFVGFMATAKAFAYNVEMIGENVSIKIGNDEINKNGWVIKEW